jgi:hypothetical protein
VKHWSSVYLEETGLLVPPAEWQVRAFLPLVGNLSFSLFDGGARTLLLSGTVGRAGPPCSVGREASWSQKHAAWGSLRSVVAGSWH